VVGAYRSVRKDMFKTDEVHRSNDTNYCDY
jgi:hypothetical protein